jgi:membrane-associated protease RseP (regulator of RpoE activity)
MIQYRFTLLDHYVDVRGLPTFIVADERIKAKFQELLLDLANHGLIARVQRVGEKLVISVFPKPKMSKPRTWINLVLLIATIATVSVASYNLIFNADSRLTAALFANANVSMQVFYLALSILGIVVVHEMGHVVAVRHHKMDASLPYFIPGLPPVGTFGAVISLRSPPGNRDQLFDLGFSGPIAGFLATILVAVFAFLTAPLLSDQQVGLLTAANLLSSGGFPHEPLILQLIGDLGLRTVPSGQVLVLTQLAFAAQVGALITFLNILPVWQLDGGHIARAVFGNRGHKLIALVGFAVLFAAGYWFFAVVLVVFMFASRRPLEGVEPLDDVSPLSNLRKVLFALALVILVFSFFIFP